jgi:hypothetical protein
MPAPPPVPPPAPPPAPIEYHTPGRREPTSDTQRVFDTVVGPNMRLKDNLIQLASVTGGALVGAVIGFAIAKPADQIVYAVLGGVGGIVAGLLISGLVIGIVRFMGGKNPK